MNKLIPISILTGYLGSGKTTLMNHILSNLEGLRVAVIVNDLGEVNIDTKLIKQDLSVVVNEDVISLSNGCICCSLKDSLTSEIARLVKSNLYDAIIIEASGVSEPLPVAQAISLGTDDIGNPLKDICYIDSIITVVDAYRFNDEFNDGTMVEEYSANEHNDESILSIVVEQIEFCDVIVLNKVDMVDDSSIAKIEEVIKKLAPSAKVIKTEYSVINTKEILFQKLFDFDKATSTNSWAHELEHEHHHHDDEHGIDTFYFESRRPFHPVRLAEWIEEEPVKLIRSKGDMWIASLKKFCVKYSQVGSSVEITPVGYWIKYTDEEEREYYFNEYPEIRDTWDEEVGDCINQLVFIGSDLNKELLKSTLDNCLLTDREMSQDWDRFEDPFFEGQNYKDL